MADNKKTVPHRQIELRRPFERGNLGLPGETVVVMNFLDSSKLKVGEEFFAKAHSRIQRSHGRSPGGHRRRRILRHKLTCE